MITPYKEQQDQLTQLLKRQIGPDVLSAIEVNTVVCLFIDMLPCIVTCDIGCVSGERKGHCHIFMCPCKHSMYAGYILVLL